MNKIIYMTVLASFILNACQSEKELQDPESGGFSIEVEISGLDSQYVYLNHYEGGASIILDSVIAQQGKFTFSGLLDLSELLWLTFEFQEGNIPLFAENSKMQVTGTSEDIEIASISGSVIHEKYAEMKNELFRFEAKFDSLVDLYYQDEEGGRKRDSIEQELDLNEENRQNYLNEVVHVNSDNPLGPFVLWRYLIYTKDLEDLKEDYNAFSETLAESEYIKSLEQIISKKENVAIGEMAPEFVQNDIEGNPIELTDVRGNYLLIDFWASWCGPCRHENPNIVKIYQDFHPKGLNILGISLDTDKENWINAIEEDNLNWTQVSDLKGWKNEVADLYVVRSIPHSVLLDPEGKIIAVDLVGEELRNELEEIFEKVGSNNNSK